MTGRVVTLILISLGVLTCGLAMFFLGTSADRTSSLEPESLPRTGPTKDQTIGDPDWQGPPDERHAVEVEGPLRAAQTRVVFQGPNGQSPGQVTAAIVAGEVTLWVGDVDESNELLVEGHVKEWVHLLALAPDCLPYYDHQQLSGKNLLVEFSRGDLVSGTLLVNDNPPTGEVGVELVTDSPFPSAFSVPKVVGAALKSKRAALVSRTSQVGADGTFSFLGLAHDWRGDLILPQTLRLDHPPTGTTLVTPSQVRMQRPLTGLILQAKQQPRIVGRVLQNTQGSPVTGIALWPRIEYEDAVSNRAIRRYVTDDKGRFAIPIDHQSFKGGTIDFLDAFTGSTLKVLKLPIVKAEGDLDLGDIALSNASGKSTAVDLLVLDEHAEPVANAHVLGFPGYSKLGLPTDLNGRSQLSLPAGASHIHIVAFGYEIEEVPVPLDPEEQVVVTLRPGATLTVSLADSLGRTLESPHVALECSAPPFRHGRFSPRTEFQAINVARTPLVARKGEQRTLELDFAGELRIAGLEPGVAFAVVVADILGRDLLRKEVVLVEGEQRVLALRLEQPICTLTGQVLAEDEQPISGAEVRVERMVNETRRALFLATTDVDGFFQFAGLKSGAVGLRVLKSGYVPFFTEEIEVREQEVPRKISLEMGHELVVTVVTEGLMPVQGAVVTAWLSDGLRVASEELPGGKYRLLDLPASQVRLQVRFVGDTHERKVSGASSASRIVLPDYGSLKVIVLHSAVPRGTAEYEACLLSSGDEDPHQRASLLWSPAGTAEVSLSASVANYEAVVRRREPGGEWVEVSRRAPVGLYATSDVVSITLTVDSDG